MEFQKKLNYLLGRLNKMEQKHLKMSLDNVHAKSLFSLVVDGKESGKLTRIFIAGKRLKPYRVQLHTHRYPIKLTVLKGDVTNIEAVISEFETIEIDQFIYKSPLNGGNGLQFDKAVKIGLKENLLPVGSSLTMGVGNFHTIVCSKGAIWMVEELGFLKDSSLVLGVPFVVEDLYTQPKQFKLNDMVQVVKKQVNNLLKTYNSL